MVRYQGRKPRMEELGDSYLLGCLSDYGYCPDGNGVSTMKRFLILLAVTVLAVLPAVPVLAIADPDSPPTVSAVYVYENCLEDGDVGVLVDYYLDYGTTPNMTATDAYLCSFIDTDGSTQLATVSPYTFMNNGYEHGMIWIYFDAAETASYGLDSANQALYKVWLMGNPTAGWAGDPPKTEAGIDDWRTISDPSTLIALRVLYYADVLELEWALDLIQETSLGPKLTDAGASYFTNVIQDLRDIAPACFSAGTLDPIYEDLDYSTEFGATMTDGTGTVAGSPITFTEGDTVVNVTGTGTFILELEKGTEGTVTDGTGVVTGSPVELVAGTNTITVTGVGTLTVSVNLADTQAGITDTVTGTAFDLTTVAADFGMTREFFSGLVWIALTIVICAASYKASTRSGAFAGGGSGKGVMIIFDICIIGGAVLGLLPVLVAALMFIGFGFLTGYILFYKGANF